MLQLAFLLLAAGHRQSPKTVTYPDNVPPETASLSEPGAPLGRLVPQLATLTGEYLGVSTAIDREVLCISVDRVKPDDLLDRIALAAGSRWVDVKGRKTLVADPAARNHIAAAGMRARVARAKEFITLFTPPAPQSDTSAPHPTDPVFRELLDGIGPDRLAEMKPGERVVFSTRPTPRQEPLAVGAVSAVTAYIGRRNDALGANKDSDDATVTANNIEYANGNLIDGPVSKANLIITRGGTFSSLDGFDVGCGELVIYGSDGKELVRQDPNLYGWCGTGQSPLHPGVYGSTSSSKPSLPESIPLRRLIATHNPNPGRRSDLKALNTKEARTHVQKLLLAPDRRDPLAYPGELLVCAAQAKHLQLVASLPDSFMAWTLTSFREARYDGGVLEDLTTDLHVVETRQGGWVVVSRASFDRAPFDRHELAQLARQLQGKKYFELNEECALANLGFGQPDANATLQLWCEFVNPILIQLNSSDGWQLLRLLGSMGIDERAAFLQSGRFTVSMLSPSALDAASAFFYSDFLTDQEGFGFEKSLLPDYRFEPTECFPSGLPVDAVLQIDDVTEPTAVPERDFSDPNENYAFANESVEALAGINAMNDSPALREACNWGPDMQHFMDEFRHVLLGTETGIKLHVFGSAMTFAFGEIHLIRLPDATVYTSATLPRGLKSLYDAEYATKAKLFTEKLAAQPGASSGPP